MTKNDGLYEHDPLYDRAVKIVLEKKMPSISLVQRHLAIGYNHAAHLLEAMEIKGVLSPLRADGTRAIRNPEYPLHCTTPEPCIAAGRCTRDPNCID